MTTILDFTYPEITLQYTIDRSSIRHRLQTTSTQVPKFKEKTKGREREKKTKTLHEIMSEDESEYVKFLHLN